ncbi:hypothetical protein J1N35_022332, partial [Gossypium stocksii]
LCQRTNVLVYNNEETISNKAVITKSIVLRFLGDDMLRASGATSTSSTPPKSPHTFPNMLEQQVINTLKQLQHQLELLSDNDDEDDELVTTHKHTKEPTRDEEPTKFAHLDSKKDDDYR